MSVRVIRDQNTPLKTTIFFSNRYITEISEMSKVIRIQEDAEEIALSYGSNVSEGIRTMEKLLKKANKKDFDLEDIRNVIRDELENINRY